jgi:hypothetical protein
MKARGDTRLLSEQHDSETGHLPEVVHVGGQYRVPEREGRSTVPPHHAASMTTRDRE